MILESLPYSDDFHLTDIVNQALVSVTKDGKVRLVSSYFYKKFKVTEEIFGTSIYELATTKEDADKLRLIIENSNNRPNIDIVKPVKINLNIGNNKSEKFNVVSTTVTTEGKHYCALILSSILGSDIIDTLKLHSDRMEITSHINSQLSHEIRSPLSAFNVNLGYLKKRIKFFLGESKCSLDILKDLEEYNTVVSEMETQVNYIEKVLNHLSEYSRLSSVNLEKVDFGDIVSATLKLMRVASSLKELDSNKLLINIEDLKDTIITGNTVWISQILWNLLINAYEAIDEDGKIYVIGKSNESYVYLRICNTGHLEDEIIEKIFDPYVTTKLYGSHRGLGLSIVKSLVLKQKGFVWAYNYFCDYSQTNTVVMNIRFPRLENSSIDTINSVTKADNITSDELFSCRI